LAAEIHKSFNVESTLVPEGKGIFDVTKDGELIFSKYQLHRFPETGEVVALIEGCRTHKDL